MTANTADAPKTDPRAVSSADRTKTLVTKLAEVMGIMRGVKKEGFNKAQNYRFVRETDVAERASEALAERRVWIHQTVTFSEMTPLYITNSGLQMWLTHVKMDFRFIDGETGEVTEPQNFEGYGADTGDKGIYKAMTGAEKYFLMKSFLVSTGDDPEADEKVDKAAAAAGATSGTRIARGRTAGVKRGGKSDVATGAQINEIARLTRDKNLSLDYVVTLAEMTSGVAYDDGADGVTFRSYLAGLPADKIGAIVQALEAEDDDAAEPKTPLDARAEAIDATGEVPEAQEEAAEDFLTS